MLSLWAKPGVLPLHLDSPKAKWTLDICIRQSVPWPIYISQVQEWPEDVKFHRNRWEQQIRETVEFEEVILEPGEAVVFSGSSQWHYRNPLSSAGEDNFCHLVFFSFVPKGYAELCNPRSWADYFGIPEIKGMTGLGTGFVQRL